MEDNQLKNEISFRKFLTGKYLLEFASLTIILGAIGIFGCLDLLDKCSIGTLMGATVGYFARGIRKINLPK